MRLISSSVIPCDTRVPRPALMHPIWTLLRRISVSLLVRQSPHPSSGRLPPRLRRAPPWALGRDLSAEPKQTAPERPTRAPERSRWEGVGDPDYLLGEIVELRDNIFYADLLLGEAGAIRVSARPSDAIALALRVGAPVRCADQVLDEAGIIIPDEQEDEVEKFREFLEQVTPEDFAS